MKQWIKLSSRPLHDILEFWQSMVNHHPSEMCSRDSSVFRVGLPLLACGQMKALSYSKDTFESGRVYRIEPEDFPFSDLLGLDPKSPRIGSNAKLYLLRQVFSQTRKKLSLK
jgi:hypothetical protein